MIFHGAEGRVDTFHTFQYTSTMSRELVYDRHTNYRRAGDGGPATIEPREICPRLRPDTADEDASAPTPEP